MISPSAPLDTPSSGPVRRLFQAPIAKSNFLKVIRTGIFLGCLTAAGSLTSCGISPSFDWEGYSQNVALERKASGTKINSSASNSRTPAIYGFSGWGGGNRIVEIVDPLVARVKVSDSQSMAFGRWPDVMGRIKSQYLAGHPVILVGHSAGCSDVLSVSNVLEKANIPVGLILIDAIYLRSGLFKPSVKGLQNVGMVPGNVYRVENYVTDSTWGGRDLTNSDLKNSARTKFKNIFISTAHLNLLGENYSTQYAESANSLLDEYSRRY